MKKRVGISLDKIVGNNSNQQVSVLPVDFNDSFKIQSCDAMKQNVSQCYVYKALKPMLFSLRVIGLHYVDEQTSFTLIFYLTRIYSSTLVTAMLVVFLVNLVPLKDIKISDLNTFTALTAVPTTLLNTLNVVCLIVASHNRKAMKKLFASFTALHNNGGLFIRYKWLKKITIASCVTCWSFIIIATILLAYNSLKIHDKSLFTIIPLEFVGGATSHFLQNIVSVIIEIYFTTILVLIDCAEMLFALILNKEFCLFARSLDSKLHAMKQLMPDNLENERQRFMKMIRLVESTDNTFFLHHSASFACNIVIICLGLYIVCYYPDILNRGNATGLYVGGLFMCFLDIATVCFSGIMVTNGGD